VVLLTENELSVLFLLLLLSTLLSFLFSLAMLLITKKREMKTHILLSIKTGHAQKSTVCECVCGYVCVCIILPLSNGQLKIMISRGEYLNYQDVALSPRCKWVHVEGLDVACRDGWMGCWSCRDSV
jgi:hypothetical protein